MAEHKKHYRSQLGRVKGSGPAHSGTHHWWMQRLTAIGLMPCSIWLLYALIHIRTFDHPQIVHWLAQPLHATLMLTTVWIGLYHSLLGIQVIIDDYVHRRLIKTASIVMLKLTVLFLAIATLVAIFSCIGAKA